MEISQTDIDFIKTSAFSARHSYIEDMENKLGIFEKKMQEKNFKIYWASSEWELTDLVFGLLPDPLYNRVCFDIPRIPEEFNNTKMVKKISIGDVENGNQSASVLLTQADFGIVESGTLVLLNKSSRNCMNLVQNIVIILDISKLLNKLSDLQTILYLRSFYQNKEYLPADVKLINRPFHRIEKNVVPNMGEFESKDVNITLIMYDNGVSAMMENNLLRQSLYCIDCGLCKTVCPMYHYTKEFSPIDLVRFNGADGQNYAETLRKNALLCGNCDKVCPVQIPLSDLLIMEMEETVTSKELSGSMAKTFVKRKKLNKVGKGLPKFFFLRKMYGGNKMLHSYFKSQSGPSFNFNWLQEHEEDE